MNNMPSVEGLERELRDLAAAIAYPQTVDVSYRVRNAITAAPTKTGWSRNLRLAAVSLGVFLIAFSALLVAAPGAREAIADFLGISGIDIRVTESPRPTPQEEGSLNLGEPTTFAEAREAVDHPLIVPPAATLGPPDEVYVDGVPAPGTVTFLYEPTDELPETVHGVGALFTQFRARLEEPLIKKIVTPGTTIEPVRMGERGYWIAGLPHEIFYRVGGEVVADRTRLASNTLLWENDGLSYRFESSLSKKEALAAVSGLD